MSESADPIHGLAQRLFDETQGYADSKHVRFGDSASDDLWKYARAAAGDIAKEPEANQSERTKLALTNFCTMVDLMIREANEMAGYRVRYPGIVGGDTLRGAIRYLRHNNFCPLWPFC